jgi:hypothetical protein
MAADAAGRGALDGVITLLALIGVRMSAEGVLLPPSAATRAQEATRDLPATIVDDAAATMRLQLSAAAAALEANGAAAATPAFEYRGFQPWGSYPMGNDWWNVDEYRRVIELIVNLRGNWVGMHSYPSNYDWPEPGVAVIGSTDSLLPDGNLSVSPYRSSWAATTRPSYGLDGSPTSAYCCGAAALFDSDCFANSDVAGLGQLCPTPSTPAAEVETWNRVGALYGRVFSFAKALGVSTALGTEMPLTLPKPEMMPLLVWWSADREDTFVTSTDCAECPLPGTEGSYVLLGQAGYIYTTPGEGRVALSSYWAEEYLDALLATSPPADPAYLFVRIEGYALAASAAGAGAVPLAQEARNYTKAALGNAKAIDTWLVSGAQWAANASARGYAPVHTAPMAWVLATGPPPPRTNSTPLFEAYEATFTRLERLYGKNLTWYWGWTNENWQWDHVTQDDPLVSDVLANAAAIEAVRKSLQPSFGFALGGWQLGPWDNRSYFDSHLPSDWPIASLDGFIGQSAPDPAFVNITHRAQRWSHPWAEDDDDLTSMQLWVGRNLAHAKAALAMGVTGHASLQWRTRTVSPQLTAVADFAWNTSLDAQDFWRSLSRDLFGPSIAEDAAAILISLDSQALPRPVNCDPGCLKPSQDACSWAAEYAFVDKWLALNASLDAVDPGSVERYEYFSSHFRYMRGMRRAECDWAAFNAVLAVLKAMPAGPTRQAEAVTIGFPALASLAANLTTMMWDQLATVSTFGELAVTTQIHSSVDEALSAGNELATLAGVPLPEDCSPAATWDPTRPPLLRVLTVRGILEAGEALNLRAVVLDGDPLRSYSVAAFVRPLNAGAFSKIPMPRVAEAPRMVFAASLPAPKGDIEWYVAALHDGGAELFFPPGAPASTATVIVMPQ